MKYDFKYLDVILIAIVFSVSCVLNAENTQEKDDTDRGKNKNTFMEKKQSTEKNDKISNLVQNTEENTVILIKMVSKLQVQMRDVLQRIDRLTPKVKATCPTQRVNNRLPLKSLNDIDDMENQLKNQDFREEYEVFIRKIGGNTSRGNIQNVLSRIFSNECSQQCSWKGRRQNFAVYKLRTITIMKEVILELHATSTEKELDDIAAEWFRFAKQRSYREMKKIQSNNDKDD